MLLSHPPPQSNPKTNIAMEITSETNEKSPVTYVKAYVAGKGIGIAIQNPDDETLFDVFGKGWSDCLTQKQFEAFRGSKRESTLAHVESIINHLNKLAPCQTN